MELLRRPSWHDKRRLSDDDTLQAFLWAYGTGELIDELNRVREIGTLADKIEAGEPQCHVGMQVSFDETFIDSHAMLVMLMDRLADCWNTNAQQDIMTVSSSLPPDSVLVLYKQANAAFNGACDSLLQMRCLYEQLKPETRDLVRRCSGRMQLERSMIAQRGQRAQGSSVFKPACGFVLQTNSSAEDTADAAADEKEVQREDVLNSMYDLALQFLFKRSRSELEAMNALTLNTLLDWGLAKIYNGRGVVG
jgi:hypothetical protein